MKSFRTILSRTIVAWFLFFVQSVQGQQDYKHMVAPKWADTLTNVLKNNAEATANGKVIYNKMCTICHGDKGKGDGAAGMALAHKPADHTSLQIQALSDGALYWMITNGTPPMPAYKAVLKDKERWQLVNYIRELGKVTSKNSKK